LRKIAVVARLLRFVVVIVAVCVAVSPLFAQEAVDVEKPGKATEEPTSEETPAKPAKESSAKSGTKPTKSLEETMRPEEFKAAGLDKLSEDEMQHLDAYLQGYRESAKKKATEQAQAKADEEIKKAQEQAKATEQANASMRTKLDSLVSRVDGSIEGVKGNTVIRLEDGSVWKQVNRDDHFRAQITDHPAAVVLRTSFGYKMRIEGMPEFYVDPVVRP
jgi:membrane-bound lytic murein transglycosylase